MEKAIWYLRELAVLQRVYRESNNEQSPVDPNEVQCICTDHLVEVYMECAIVEHQFISTDVNERRTLAYL